MNASPLNTNPAQPRLAAAECLHAVTDEGRTLDDAFAHHRTLRTFDARDRAFAHALTLAALRRLGGLDQILNRFLSRPIDAAMPAARALLRIGAAQILVLGTPAHAAVGETVNAAHRGAPKAVGLLNAVLRKLAALPPGALDALPPGADLPPWLFARWRASYGDDAANAIAVSLRTEPPLDLSAKSEPESWAARLAAALTPTGSIRLSAPHAALAELEGFAEGAWWVQDAAAALPACLLGAVRDRDVLDLCAAPGGKTMQLAAAGARVTALDRDEKRLARVAENLARTKLHANLVAADARDFRPAKRFDAVLLDAPCSATGTLRRHPDAAWLRRPSDIQNLSNLQSELLAAAHALLKPEGVLVYAVCSLEPEEGPSVIENALASGQWRRANLSTDKFPSLGEFLTRDGDLRTHPGLWPERGGLDGFFASRLRVA